MQCPRCLNTDEEYFFKGSKGWYCRKCISFGRIMLEEDAEPVSLSSVSEGSEEYTLQYPLTKAQAEIAVKCSELIDKTDVLLHCVCGAGKTELVVLSIAKMLKERKKVCFAIPRRQVVLELRERLALYFPHAKVTAVCGGHTQETDGDLIICTTHQLYRYYQAFDLLILDEPDAFPFQDNDVLYGIAQTACRGRTLYLSATPDRHLLERAEEGSLKMLKLMQRPHGYPMPVPEVFTAPASVLLLKMMVFICHHSSPLMIFVPSKRTARVLGFVINAFMPCAVCTSDIKNRDKVIDDFRKGRQRIMVTTTVMERGVTIPGADIIVFEADHPVFNIASLAQMAGRAGRSFDHPDGSVLFLCRQKCSAAYLCRKETEEANETLSSVRP